MVLEKIITTDSLNSGKDKINIAIDQVDNLNLFKTSTFTAKFSDNIADESKIVIGKRLGVGGDISDNAVYKHTDYIHVNPGEIIRIYDVYGIDFLPKTSTVVYYDINKTYISGVNSVTQVTVPIGVNYIRVGYSYNQWHKNLMITRNKVATAYSKYEPTFYSATNTQVISTLIDSTLSKEGMIPDSKAVGEALKNINVGDIIETQNVGSDNRLHTISSGYYWNGVHNESASYNHSNKIPVKPGEIITLQYGSKDVSPQRLIASIRFLDAYREDGSLFESKAAVMSYTVPTDVTELRISAAPAYLASDKNSSIVNSEIVIAHDEYKAPEMVHFIKGKDIKNTVHVYLPKEIPVAIGRTIELYNDLVCLEAKKYHLQWESVVGISYRNKFSITGNKEGSYPLTLTIYDDYMNEIYQGFSTIKVSANKIASPLNILPIGDSLTNLKPWLQEVQTLSGDKIKYIGTRGRSDQTIRHEGRSGWDAKLYNTAFNYTFETNYQGVPTVTSATNPFWNGSKFSLKHYIDTQSQAVGTPNAVQIYLGTNGLQLDNTENVNYIKQMVDNIRLEYPTMPIFVCNTIYRSNQNGYYSTGTDGYNTSLTGLEFEEDLKIMDLQTKVQDAFNNMSNVFIIPLSITMDRDNNFGQVEVQVNPRNPETIKIASESVHPQEPGYLQMADVMYSSYVNHLI